MLAHIHICNLGIIEDVEIDFDKGLNILTGETGAGKTLIIGAISMICGGKASKDIIRNGEEKAFVEALFYVEDEKLKKILSDMGYEEDELVISRELFSNGRSIAKINGRLVTVNELKELGKVLIDIHGQHDNQSLLDEKKHIEVIDNFAGQELSKIKEEYLNLYYERKRILEDIERLGGEPEKRLRSMEFLKFQIDEIESANLKTGEEEELIKQRKVLANAEKLAQNISYGYDVLSTENGVLNCLEKVRNKLGEVVDIKENFAEISKNLDEAYYQIEDISHSLANEKENIYVDEEELDNIDERLDLISKLKKKYGNSIDEILKSYESMKKEYNELLNSEELINKLNSDLKVIEEKLRVSSEKISEKRKVVAHELESKLANVLNDLEMPKSRFKINITNVGKFLINGSDEVEILFSSNIGEDVKPLYKIASGGEISRIMLALKNILMNADIIPVMIFDEIDTGISGEAGFAVGDKMREIAKNKQIICVTHLPSIAARGEQNYYISKSNIDNKTVTSVKRLNEEETVYEIARIISGGNISETALLHAKEIRES
jgi:DNA repair protein RecN (Recombination protein N)